MHLKIRHEIAWTLPSPARGLVQHLRLAPRSFEAQHARGWRLHVDADCRVKSGEDAFGNLVHSFSLDLPAGVLKAHASGEIDTFDLAGLARGAPERFPPELYLRETALTAGDAAIEQFARDAAGAKDSALAQLHALMGAIHAGLTLAPEREATGAAAVLKAQAGPRAGFAHCFIVCARRLGHPARFVQGYFAPETGGAELAAWAEAHVEGLGWIGFDASRDHCPQERHVRLAIGLDAEGAAPARGNLGAPASHRLEILG